MGCCNVMFFYPPCHLMYSMLGWEEESPLLCPPHPCFLVFSYALKFLKRVFLVFVANLGQSRLGTVDFPGPTQPFEKSYMTLVFKINMTWLCLWLQRSNKAWVCLNQSGFLCTLSVSPTRHIPVICYYLFFILLILASAGICHEVFITM